MKLGYIRGIMNMMRLRNVFAQSESTFPEVLMVHELESLAKVTAIYSDTLILTTITPSQSLIDVFE